MRGNLMIHSHLSHNETFEPDTIADYTEETMPDVENDVMIVVGDQQIPLSKITEEDKERMTGDEYTIYAEKYQEVYGGGDYDNY